MSAKCPESTEGVVLKSIDEVVDAAEEKNGPWPELDEPSFPSGPEGPDFVGRVILWTMAGVVCAVTIAAIAKWDQRVLLAVLGLAATTLLGLAGLKRETRLPEKREHDQRTKKRAKKRTQPG